MVRRELEMVMLKLSVRFKVEKRAGVAYPARFELSHQVEMRGNWGKCF